ncbi:MAG: agmatinase [Spartobacteria bacterium]
MRSAAKSPSSSPPRKVALAGIPWDENSSFARGPAEAPPLIRAALFSEASGLRSENGFEFRREDLHDAGDVPPRTGAEMLGAIEHFSSALLAQGLRPLSLGGDHAVTYPIVKALGRKYSDLTILQFDAHTDLYDSFEGNRYSHACPFARIMEEGLAKRLVQVGIRTLNREQRAQAERFGVEIIEMKDWRDGRALVFDGPVYLSFDVDALDPAFAPGVSHQEPGGFTTRQVLDALCSLKADLVGADLVEFNPRCDVANLTANLAAKLVKEIAAKMFGEKAQGKTA